jgi:hypothetical protein
MLVFLMRLLSFISLTISSTCLYLAMVYPSSRAR